jgi:hypothetical protein
MDQKLYTKVLLTVLIAIFVLTNVKSQNCAGIQDLDILNIAKQVDVVKIKNISITPGKIKADTGFKFVQLRDTETYVLVPDDFQGRILSLAAFLPTRSKSSIILDKDKMAAKLVCQVNSNTDQHCRHLRISKQVLGCTNCPDAKWTSASVLSDVGVIIPPYRHR